MVPSFVFAADPIGSHSNLPDFQLQIPLSTLDKPGFNTSELVDGSALGKYIGAIYKWLAGAIGILSLIVFAWAGLMWLTARGDDGQVKKAQKLLTDSLAGLVLILGSYVILNTLNPNLVKLNALNIKPIGTIDFEMDTAIPTRAYLAGGMACRDPIECISGYCIRGVCVDVAPLDKRNGGCCYKTSGGARRAYASKLNACKTDLAAKLTAGQILETPRYFCAYPPDGGTLTPDDICWKAINLSDERSTLCKDFEDFTGKTKPLPTGAVKPGECIDHSDCKDASGNVDLTKYCNNSSKKCEDRIEKDKSCDSTYVGRDCLSGFCEGNKCIEKVTPAVAKIKGVCCYEAQDKRGSASMGSNQVAENLQESGSPIVSYQACQDYKRKDNGFPITRKWFCLNKTDVSACGPKSGGTNYKSWSSINETDCNKLFGP